MSGLVLEMAAKALKLNIPLSVQLDLTYRCNERCIHCYLDHDDHGEMTTAEIKDLLDQMADAGVFYLTISGGEILMRRDFFEILEHARLRTFCVKLKTNGVLIREKEARRRFVAERWNNWRWLLLLRFFFSNFVMGRLGRDPAFFDHVEGRLADHVARRIDHAAIDLDPSQNPYLHWILKGTHGEALPLAWRREHFETIGARLDRAYRNFLETFVFFAAAVLLAHALGKSTHNSALGAEIYLWARVLYVPAYAFGIPYLRTIIWVASLIGIMMVMRAIWPGM